MAVELIDYLRHEIKNAAPDRRPFFETELQKVEEKSKLGEETPKLHFAVFREGHLYHGFDVTKVFWKQALSEDIAPPQSKGKKRLWERNLQITSFYINAQSNFAAVGRSFGLSKEVVAKVVRGTISHVWTGTTPETQRQFPLFLLPLTTYKGVLHPVQSERREQVDLSDMDKRIIELRAQRVKGKEIRAQLDLTEGQYHYRVSKLLHTSETTTYPRAGRSVGGRARAALERVFERCLAHDPDKAVSLSWLAREVGINRERARQLYPQIAAERKVPPLISRKLPKDLAEFDQRVDELGAQGLNSAEISGKLYVAKTLVKQAQRRVTEKKQEADQNKVRELREQGYGNKIIVKMTGLTRAKVDHILEDLIPKGEARRLRKKRRTKEEIEQLKKKVVQLRLDPRNLTAKRIAEITGEEEYSIVTYTSKLIAEGRIPKRGY